jgi:hypothetical protein
MDKLELMSLEAMIDKHGISAVLGNLALICDEKSIHIEQNWQDVSTAAWWHKRAKAIEALTFKPLMQDA